MMENDGLGLETKRQGWEKMTGLDEKLSRGKTAFLPVLCFFQPCYLVRNFPVLHFSASLIVELLNGIK